MYRVAGGAQPAAASASPPARISRLLIATGLVSSPIVHRAVLQPVHRQVGALVGVTGGELFIELDAEAGGVTGVERYVAKAVAVREDGVRLLGVAHIFLDSEIRHRQVEVK